MAPLWLFAGSLLVSFALSEQQVFRSQAIQLARQAATVVEGELERINHQIDWLSLSTEFVEGNMAAFHAVARRLTARPGQAVFLHDATGRPLLGTGAQFGASFETTPALSSERMDQLKADHSHVSDVYLDASTQMPAVAVAKLVRRGTETFVLSIQVPARNFHEVLVPVVPHEWVVGVGDRQGTYVARSARHDEVAGKPGGADYLAKASEASGSFVSSNVFGEDLLAGYFRSSENGWLFGANVPLALVEAPLWRTIWTVVAIGACALVISLLVAYAVGRRLTHDASQLVTRANELLQGRTTEPLGTPVSEFAQIGEAFVSAGRALSERTKELETVIATVPAAVWFTYDPTARLVVRNRFAAELMGLSAQDLQHYNQPDMVIDTIAMKDGKVVNREDRPLTRAMRGELTDQEEFTYVLLDGSHRYLLSSARPIMSDSGAIIGAVQVSLDITERKRGEEQRRLLAKEMHHRVKNNLALVQALAQQTFRHSSSLPEAATAFSARLAALSKAQDVLNRHEWTSGILSEVIKEAVAPHAAADRYDLEGPSVPLSPNLVLAVTLVVHELTTNAVKYGALSTAEGHIAVRWERSERDGASLLQIEWKEKGGPPVAGPGGRGFGSRLLKRLADAEGGSTSTSFEPDGIRCTITLPLNNMEV